MAGSFTPDVKRRQRHGRVPSNLGILGGLLKSFVKDQINERTDMFVNKGPSCQGNGFSSSHVWM